MYRKRCFYKYQPDLHLSGKENWKHDFLFNSDTFFYFQSIFNVIVIVPLSCSSCDRDQIADFLQLYCNLGKQSSSAYSMANHLSVSSSTSDNSFELGQATTKPHVKISQLKLQKRFHFRRAIMTSLPQSLHLSNRTFSKLYDKKSNPNQITLLPFLF